MTKEIQNLCVKSTALLREAVAIIDRNEKGIVLVVDDEDRLLSTITDGDVRRFLLAGQNLDTPVAQLLGQKKGVLKGAPITASVGASRVEILGIMHQHSIRQVPLVDIEGRVAGVVTLDELMPNQVLPLQAVIMAGGYGKRLGALTQNTPKPMLPVGEQPLIETIIEQLRQSGIQKVNISTHYLPEKIREHFGDGSAFGVNLNYVQEDQPLGTAGAIGLMQASKEPILVVNGDILTELDYKAMLDFHRNHRADLTVAVRQYSIQVPYGVVQSKAERVYSLREKPELSFLVNAGIYLLEPAAQQAIPQGERFDMTDLIEEFIALGRNVVSFPIREYWMDIGQVQDYTQAQTDVREGKVSMGFR